MDWIWDVQFCPALWESGTEEHKILSVCEGEMEGPWEETWMVTPLCKPWFLIFPLAFSLSCVLMLSTPPLSPALRWKMVPTHLATLRACDQMTLSPPQNASSTQASRTCGHGWQGPFSEASCLPGCSRLLVFIKHKWMSQGTAMRLLLSHQESSDATTNGLQHEIQLTFILPSPTAVSPPAIFDVFLIALLVMTFALSTYGGLNRHGFE